MLPNGDDVFPPPKGDTPDDAAADPKGDTPDDAAATPKGDTPVEAPPDWLDVLVAIDENGDGVPESPGATSPPPALPPARWHFPVGLEHSPGRSKW